MSDSNLNQSITSIVSRSLEVAPAATAKELLDLSKIAPRLEQNENVGLENVINARAQILAAGAAAKDLKMLGKSIGNVLEMDSPVVAEIVPSQANLAGKFLGSNAVSKNWSDISIHTLHDIQLTTIETGETLVYDDIAEKFQNSSSIFSIAEYAATAQIPASATTGTMVLDLETSKLKYWDGSEWVIGAVVSAAAAGVSNAANTLLFISAAA